MGDDRPRDGAGDDQGVTVLGWSGMAIVLTVIAFRVCTPQAAELVFDVDPLIAGAPQQAVGPALSLTLDVCTLLGAAAIMLGELLRGRGLSWIMVLLAVGPTPLLLHHGLGRAESFVLGSAWISAMIGATALSHLARDLAARRLILTLLLALAGPLLVRGGWQLLVEHPAMVATYDATRESFLAARGWSPDSTAATLYEERLRQPEATGWFGFSNVYSALLVTLGLAWSGAALSGRAARRDTGLVGGAVIVVIAAAVLVAVNGSKGALAAAVIGAALLTAGLLRRGAFARGRWTPWLLVLLPLLGVAAVVGRGALPEDFLGDRSLLFRWQYLVGGLRILETAPWTGVGADGFKDAYLLVRLPRAPEEVASAHGATIDWLVAAGVGGSAWCAWLLWSVGRAGHAARRDFGEEPPTPPVPRRALMATVVAVGMVGLLGGVLLEAPALAPADVVSRGVGALSWLLLVVLLGRLIPTDGAARGSFAWAVAVAAAVLGMHAQIEMVLWLAASSGAVLAFVGVAGPAPRPGRTPAARRVAAGVAAVASVGTVGLAAAIAVTGVAPAWRQETLVREAAASLHGLARTTPTDGLDPAAVRAARGEAATTLTDAWRAWPTSRGPAIRAIEQWMGAARGAPGNSYFERMDHAIRLLEELARPGPRGAAPPTLRVIGADARVRELIAEQAGMGHVWTAPMEAWLRVVEVDPHGLEPRLRVAYAAEQAGIRRLEIEHLRAALRIDENLELDPRRRLTEEQRRAIEMRLERIDPPHRRRGSRP